MKLWKHIFGNQKLYYTAIECNTKSSGSEVRVFILPNVFVMQTDIKIRKRTDNCHFTSKDVNARWWIHCYTNFMTIQNAKIFVTLEKIMTIHQAFRTTIFRHHCGQALCKQHSRMHSERTQNGKHFCDTANICGFQSTLYSISLCLLLENLHNFSWNLYFPGSSMESWSWWTFEASK